MVEGASILTGSSSITSISLAVDRVAKPPLKRLRYLQNFLNIVET